MLEKIRRLLPHAAILICNMYIVFYLIDLVNTAMCFIDNGMTKGLLVVMCVISIICSLNLIAARKRAQAARRRAAQARPSGTRPQPSGAPYPQRSARPSGSS